MSSTWAAAALAGLAVLVLRPADALRRIAVRPRAGRWPRALGLLGVRPGARRRREAARRREVVEGCLALAAELDAGHEAARALGEAARAAPLLAPAARAAAVGGDVTAALRAAAAPRGAEAHAALAAGWALAERTGIPLAALCRQVVAAVRDDAARCREVAVQLSPVRATSRLLAALPLLPLAMGSALGGAPWRELTGSSAGRICLLGGVALVAAGLVWVGRLAASAEASPWRS